MRKIPLSLLLALVSACVPETPAPGEPHILSITPNSQASGATQVVTVALDTDPLFLVDYNHRSVQMLETPMLSIGSQTVPMDRYLGNGTFTATVGPGMDPGTYDVRVSLGDGREATLAEAYRVKSLVGYWFDHIDDQVQDQPFTITIHADAPNFTGTVLLHVYDAQRNDLIVPIRTGAFSAGARKEELTVHTSGDTILVSVEDDDGNSSYSNAFLVSPSH